LTVHYNGHTFNIMNAATLLSPDGTVSTEWLAARLEAPWLRVVDVRVGPFVRGRIPGSTLLDVGKRLVHPDGSLVSAPELAMAMSEIGVGDAHTVVLVDGDAPLDATIAAKALRRYGHQGTHVLAGGFPRWARERRPVVTELARHPFASFTARTPS
jgi:thiosulfate/3-mercaptopyruvate sulfurtransferase